MGGAEKTRNPLQLGHAIALLRTDFSKEAARKKQGGELTSKEKAEFEKIKAQQKELLAKIKKLEKAAQKDKALAKGLGEIQNQATHILKEPATMDAYIARSICSISRSVLSAATSIMSISHGATITSGS